MFSESEEDPLMGVATATESRAVERLVYLPADKLGMAHRSWVSPDGKWILVSEMDMVGWRPCRVLPFRWEDKRRDRRSEGSALHIRRLEPGWQNDVLQRGCGGRISISGGSVFRMASRNR